MSKGYSLIIGLNSVNPLFYNKWDGALTQPENDAQAISKIAISAGFKTKLVLSEEATRDKIYKEFETAAKELTNGDVFFLYYSGHGGQIKDLDMDEEDGYDETWCLYDGQMLDDEINLFFTTFESGVRIIVISDSCHSGTITKALPWEEPEFVGKGMPDEYIQGTFKENEAFYVDIVNKLKAMKAAEQKLKASVLLISGCQDYEESLAFKLDTCSAFTTEILKSLSNGQLNYAQLQEQTKKALDERLMKYGRRQTPNMYLTGEEYPAFMQESFLQI